jgi:hypothetical protein
VGPTPVTFKLRSIDSDFPFGIVSIKWLQLYAKKLTWDEVATLLSYVKLCLQGSYQTNWQDILDATNPNDDCNVNFFEEKVKKMLSDIFTEDECSEMANYIHNI